MRKIAELGLKKDYETNHEFALALKMLPALAFETKEQIGNSYDKIVEEIQIVCNRKIKESEKIAIVDELCLYFGSNYIKSLVPNREALFPPSIWNQRDAASSGLARTTNAVKGSIQTLNFYNASSGHQFTEKKKNRVLNEKVPSIACLRRKNGFAFLSRYGELELNICFFVLCIYFQFPHLLYIAKQ